MKKRDLLKRIEELERRVRELEARPTQHIVTYPQPAFVQPTIIPAPDTSPYPPGWPLPTIIC